VNRAARYGQPHGAELRATDASSSRGPRRAGSRDARGHREWQRRRATSRPCRVAASSRTTRCEPRRGCGRARHAGRAAPREGRPGHAGREGGPRRGLGHAVRVATAMPAELQAACRGDGTGENRRSGAGPRRGRPRAGVAARDARVTSDTMAAPDAMAELRPLRAAPSGRTRGRQGGEGRRSRGLQRDGGRGTDAATAVPGRRERWGEDKETLWGRKR
jgi:hypothetical protein